MNEKIEPEACSFCKAVGHNTFTNGLCDEGIRYQGKSTISIVKTVFCVHIWCVFLLSMAHFRIFPVP